MAKKHGESPPVPREIQLKAVMSYHIQSITAEIFKISQN